MTAWLMMLAWPETQIFADAVSADAVRVAFDFFSKRAALGFIVPEWLPTPENVQYHAAVAQLDNAVYRIIADRKQRLSELKASSKQGQVRQLQWHAASLSKVNPVLCCAVLRGAALHCAI